MSKAEELQSRMIELAKRTLSQTIEGKIKWTATDHEDEYVYPGSSTSLSVEMSNYANDDYSYRFCLLNGRGTVVEQLSDATSDPGHETLLAQLLQELYESARRSALDIDALIESAINDVDRGYEASDKWGDEPPF